MLDVGVGNRQADALLGAFDSMDIEASTLQRVFDFVDTGGEVSLRKSGELFIAVARNKDGDSLPAGDCDPLLALTDALDLIIDLG